MFVISIMCSCHVNEIMSCKLNRLKVNYTVIIWFLVHYIQINMVPVWLDDHFNYMYCDTSTSGQVKDYFHVYGVPYLVVYINLMPWACFVMIFMNFQFFSIKLEFCKSSRLIVWNWNLFPSHTPTKDWETQTPLKMVMNSGAPEGYAILTPPVPPCRLTLFKNPVTSPLIPGKLSHLGTSIVQLMVRC